MPELTAKELNVVLGMCRDHAIHVAVSGHVYCEVCLENLRRAYYEHRWKRKEV